MGKMMVNGRSPIYSCCSRHDPTSQGRFRQIDKAAVEKEIDEQLEDYYED